MTANVGRWRRMDHALNELSEARFSGEVGKCPDAVVRALDAFNYLWNGYHGPLRSVHVKPPKYSEDRVVEGQPGGETAAALVFARGEMTHDGLVEGFGHLTDTFSDTFSDLFGVWRWQPYPEKSTKYHPRFEWYSEHVAGEEVLPPFVRAVEWLKSQPGVTGP